MLMKFKKGQKVRVKVWEDMPQDLYGTWGKARNIGEIVIIEGVNTFGGGNYTGYDIAFDYGETTCYFEEELEPVIKVGEQLLFAFMGDVV